MYATLAEQSVGIYIQIISECTATERGRLQLREFALMAKVRQYGRVVTTATLPAKYGSPMDKSALYV